MVAFLGDVQVARYGSVSEATAALGLSSASMQQLLNDQRPHVDGRVYKRLKRERVCDTDQTTADDAEEHPDLATALTLMTWEQSDANEPPESPAQHLMAYQAQLVRHKDAEIQELQTTIVALGHIVRRLLDALYA